MIDQQLLEMIEIAHRLRAEGSFVARIASYEGEPVMAVVAIGAGARALAKLIDSTQSLDPRSCDDRRTFTDLINASNPEKFHD